MHDIHFLYLNGPDIEALELTDDEILDAVEAGLRAQGDGATVIEPRVHLEPDPAFRGHFNVLRGYVAPMNLAGVKVVGDYIDNYTKGLPSEMALLNLFDPRTGMPTALLDATAITEMRTGAVTALGAHLSRRLAALAESPAVANVRSVGLMAGVQLARWPEGVGRHGQRVLAEAESRGVLFRAVDDTIVISPPFIITEEEIDHLVATLSESIEAAKMPAAPAQAAD